MYRYMSIIFSKRLLLLILCIGLSFSLPEVNITRQVGSYTALAANLTPVSNSRAQYVTPQQLQQQQSVLQRRNLEIQKVLNHPQQSDLKKLMHSESNFNQAIAKLEISSQQREMLKTIQQLYSLKLEALKK
jgi:negative regulator of sigma E activity